MTWLEAILAFLWDLLTRALTAHPAAASTPIASVTVPGTAITLGELRAAAVAAPSFVAALGRLVEGHASLADGEVLADDAISVGLAFADPEAAPFAAIAPIIANLFLEGVASGQITGGSGANADPLGRGGRRS